MTEHTHTLPAPHWGGGGEGRGLDDVVCSCVALSPELYDCCCSSEDYTAREKGLLNQSMGRSSRISGSLCVCVSVREREREYGLENQDFK